MSASRKRPPVVAIGFVAVAVTAVVYFVFLRGSPDIKAASIAALLPIPEPSAEPPKGVLSKTEESPAPSPLQESALTRAVRELCAAEKWFEARSAVAKAFAAATSDEERGELAEIALQVHRRILAAPESADARLYEIQAGDSLTRIAGKSKNLQGCFGPILLLNDIKDPNATLRLGRKIKIPTGTWSIVVDKSLFTLWICYEGAPFKSYRVAIGLDEKTPAALFAVGNKQPKPAWYPPQEMIPDLKKQAVPIPIPYGHEKNPLGEYWIALDHPHYSGLGIHGTNDPASLGRKASNGCIRMDNKDVMMIAWTAVPKMVVTIVD